MIMVGHHYFGLQQCVMIRTLLFVQLFMVTWAKIMLNQCHAYKKKHNWDISILFYMLVCCFSVFLGNNLLFLLSVITGDMAYDMDVDNARYGDAYMNAIESVAGYIPYMTCPGNHENA